jgi:glycosyl transferase family 1
VGQHPATVYKIGCAARFEPQKDHDTLFRALGILRERGMSFECRLAGAGCEASNARLMDMIWRYGLADHVVPLGFVAHMGEFYRGIDLLVLSSPMASRCPLPFWRRRRWADLSWRRMRGRREPWLVRSTQSFRRAIPSNWQAPSNAF